MRSRAHRRRCCSGPFRIPAGRRARSGTTAPSCAESTAWSSAPTTRSSSCPSANSSRLPRSGPGSKPSVRPRATSRPAPDRAYCRWGRARESGRSSATRTCCPATCAPRSTPARRCSLPSQTTPGSGTVRHSTSTRCSRCGARSRTAATSFVRRTPGCRPSSTPPDGASRRCLSSARPASSRRRTFSTRPRRIAASAMPSPGPR